jgi:hypothetical protein
MVTQHPDANPWAPAGIDPRRPSAARVYDYLLGGSHNFPADRELAERFLEAMPDTRLIAQENRAFLRRAVQYLVDTGVRQFIDLGSGIPTVGNVHEIAQRVAPDTRVLYVDIDPVAVAHSQRILAGVPGAEMVQADIRQPDAVLDHPDLRGLLDLDQPVAILLVAALHFIVDEDDPYGILAHLRDRVAAGSHLVISHLTHDFQEQGVTAMRQLAERGGTPTRSRTRAEITRMFTGFELVEPGLVWTPLWRPDVPDDPDEVDDRPQRANLLAGVGRKP